MKRQLAEGEKIFVNHISDKGLIYKIGRELIQQQKAIIQFKEKQKT